MKKVIVFVSIALFALFLFLFAIMRAQPPINRAIDELTLCYSKEDIKNVFDKHKQGLTITNENLEKEIDREFLQEVRKKLSSMNLSETEIIECKQWLPPVPTSLNLIIVPDLSKRIIDEINNPDQITNDTILLNYIWKAFESYTKQRVNTKPRLIVDITDEGQASGQFRFLADNLVFELPEHRTPHLRNIWFETVGNRYTKNIKALYALGKNNPIGADYWSYFRRNLSKHIQKSTLFDNYRNVLIIITDGYLEAEYKLYTGDLITRNAVVNKIKRGNLIEDAVLSKIKIPDIVQKFPTLEVLILEVNERKRFSPQEPKDKGTTEDYDILMVLWRDWFKQIQVKNVDENFFIQRSDATQLTKNEIDRFLNHN
jgi:hypothetical protein